MGNFYMESTQINYRRDEKTKTVDQKLQELSETSAIDTDIAPVFKSTNTYQQGDMVYYRNKLYVFNVEHTGTWAAADVTATDVTTEISSLKSGLTNVTTLAHQDYIDVYQNGVTVHVYLRSSSTPTPSDSNILLREMPIPKGAKTIFTTFLYHDGTNRQIGMLKVNNLGQILIDGFDDSALKGVSYLVGELVYLIS